MTGMNVKMDHINVLHMPHVETQLDPTPAHAELAILGMEWLAVTGMNVMMDHINVHLMPHVEILLAPTPAPAIQATLGMEELVLEMI